MFHTIRYIRCFILNAFSSAILNVFCLFKTKKIVKPKLAFFFSLENKLLLVYYSETRPPRNKLPVYVKRLDPKVLAFRLSLHRHPNICSDMYSL